jgi:ABC-2 type transport system permease protein
MTRPASHATVIAAQLAMDLRLTARRSENVLVTVVIPAAVLLFFASVPVLALDETASGGSIDFLLPGALALAVIATSMVNLGIATAYERHYGVLKRLGGTPLGRADLVAARLGSIALIETVQVILLVALSIAVLGWEAPVGASAGLALVALVLGTGAFAGIGLLLAGTLRAEATLAVANGLFLASLLLGGIIQPLDRLPEVVASVAALLPAAALAETLRIALGSSSADVMTPLVTLAAWAVGSLAAAVRWFRWD